jgi:hypothetical protein
MGIRIRGALVSVLVALVATSACEGGAPAPRDGGAGGDASALVAVDPDVGFAAERVALGQALDRGEPRVVLVLVEEGSALIGGSSPRDRVASLVPVDDVVLVPSSLPVLAVRVRDRATLAAIEAVRGVLRVEPERQHAHASPQLDLIGQPASLSRGADGRGLSVAVVDTGGDYTRAELGHCTAPGTPAGCMVPYAHDFAPSDGTLDQAEHHGTNVSCIVRSVAPDVQILPLDVFNGASASSTDILAAIDWIITNRATYSIVAANFSLGYGAFTAPCGGDVLAAAMQRLRDAGVVPVVATGNAGAINGISSPACGPASVSVGAVDSAGVVASFSNAASFMTLLAPGVLVDAGGVVMSGTSQATPHVSGAVAALRTLYASESIDDLVLRMRTTGVATTDARNGLVVPRLNLDAASAGADGLPPTGTLTLPAATRTPTVSFTLSASDASGVASMCVSTATTCTTFVPFATSGSVTLATGDGTKTVRAWLRDALGNTTFTPVSATTVLDTVAPTGGAAVATRGIGRVDLALSGFTDARSGLARYRVVFSTGTAAPTSCATGTLVSEGTSTSVAHEGLVNGTTYRYRACAIDNAGNVSTGVTASAIPAAELDAPTGGSVVIAGDAAWTRTATVALALSATDASAVTQMCIGTTAASCTAWRAFAASSTTSLTAGSGVRTVYAWFRDTWGNATTTPVSDTIQIDTVAPPNATVVASAGARSVTLSWVDVVDAAGGSGLADYLVRSASGSIPTNCTGGTVIAMGGAPHTITLASTGTTAVGWRVCARDAVGNVAAGRTGLTTPLP